MGGTWDLADQHPERFTMVVFFRGLHCPVCQAQLRELDERIDELSQRVIAIWVRLTVSLLSSSTMSGS